MKDFAEAYKAASAKALEYQCEGCALAEHDAYICARWRLSYAVNELKKAIPLVRRTAAENRCMAGLWERRRNTTPPARWQSSG